MDDTPSPTAAPRAPHGYSKNGRPRSHPPTGKPPGRPRKHALRAMRDTVRELTTRRLDGRSAVAVAVRGFKQDIRRDLGGDLTRAQEVILEDAAQTWVIRSSLDDWIGRQPTVVTKKRALLPVVSDRMRIAEHLARQLDRLGLDRKARPVASIRDLAARTETP